MSRKRKQKRFTSEQSILAAIEACRTKKVAYLKTAEDHEAAAKKFIEASLARPLSLEEVEDLAWQKKLAATARKSADRQDGVIAKLRRTQDAFDTGVFPGMIKDQSVVFDP